MSDSSYIDIDLEEGDWYGSMNMGIDEVNLMYDHVCYAVDTWDGSIRPKMEKDYLMIMKLRLYAMKKEHAFTEL